MLHKKLSFYIALGGVAAAALMVVHLHSESPLPPPAVEPHLKPWDHSLAASGIVESLSENIAIGVPLAGLVADVHVSVSDSVEQGQPLFTIDGRELEAQLRVHQANVSVVSAQVQRLEDQLARLNSVHDPRAVSRDEVNTKIHDVAVAHAQLQVAQAHVAQTEALLRRLTVLAPRSGTILQVNVRAGEYASATPKVAAMVMGDLMHLQVRADVDEQNAHRIEAGQQATAYLKGDTTAPIALRFVRIEPYVVAKTSLTGASTERVDTRVLQVIYAFDRPTDRSVYIGQQVDLYVPMDVNSSSGIRVASAQAKEAL